VKDATFFSMEFHKGFKVRHDFKLTHRVLRPFSVFSGRPNSISIQLVHLIWFSSWLLLALQVINNHYTQRQYILYRCGASESDLDLSAVTLPTGYQRRAYSTPATKVIALETTSLGYLQAIDTGVGSMGLADRLLAISRYAVDPCMRKAVISCTDSSTNKGEASRTCSLRFLCYRGRGIHPECADTVISANVFTPQTNALYYMQWSPP
jgi:hypothetical protein